MLQRREFVHSIASTTAAAWLGRSVWGQTKETERLEEPAHRAAPRIAFLATDVYRHSHAQHFLDRFAVGYAMGGKWRAPRVEIAGVYIDQFNERDLGKQRLQKYGLKSFPSIAEALTLGGDTLAVDGVVIIGEHGKYPRNEKGQTLYPRYEWFKEVLKVFEQSDRSVPVFNDKHLSTDWRECREMVTDSRRLEFPFYAGSSLPVTWRLPAYELPWGAELQESVCVAYGGVDSYDFHALETAQCMSERRVGGEVGVKSIHAMTNEQVYQELAARELTRRLFVSALTRSHSLPTEGGFPTGPVTFEWAQNELPQITGYFIEHLDGFRTSIFLTGIRDFNYAGWLKDKQQAVGCQMMLPMPGRNATTADFFNPLSAHIEEMMVRRATDYPIERTLLTSGMVIGGVESLFRGEQRYEPPDMDVRYKSPRASMFWRQ